MKRFDLMTFRLKKVNNSLRNNIIVGFATICQIQASFSQVTLDANGPGNTYVLTDFNTAEVLAQGRMQAFINAIKSKKSKK